MATFEPGDVVILKSGGPKMTVRELFNNGEWAYLCYFLEGKLYLDQAIATVVLKKADPDAEGGIGDFTVS
ncbi:DUF2158 domain-containing protein [Hymenobacter sp. YC55]|uniref:DUF2158 domain-containing protein n=1 Tax=Hymenobacter sp. YC55 TaxID=3034019 RepID=UPI0023F80AFC|nr:DUF2158 domain-containing protein [Hymenobacter sp. YC55]MDF7809936.1 DUF2158 domain-containing protein [Hymenobacter sp. YC55]